MLRFKMFKLVSLILTLAHAVLNSEGQNSKPNIIMIVVDDLGFNDVPWNNPDSLAVHIGHYARSGVILDRHYVSPKCSPSRASLLTGRYPWKMGRQRGAIERYQPTGLSTKYKLLPQFLKTAGYATHAVGKWHLGYCDEKYLPTRRGFDTFFGMLQQSTHYKKRTITCTNAKFQKGKIGYDLRRNESISYEYGHLFSPDMYAKEVLSIIKSHKKEKPLFLYLAFQAIHKPLVGTPPQRYKRFYRKGKQSEHDMRQIFLSAMDYAVHKVIVDLKFYGLYENSVILFTTDNGGGPWYSNQPLRGTKETVYEGGIRGVSFFLSPLLKKSGYKNKGLIHISDWVPTFLNIAGLHFPSDLDGLDQWSTITNNKPSPRKEIVHNIDKDQSSYTFQSTISFNEWKLIWGQEYLLKRLQPEQRRNVQLYDIFKDPSEQRNLATSNPTMVIQLQERINELITSELVEADYPKNTNKGWPVHFDGFISPGWCTAP